MSDFNLYFPLEKKLEGTVFENDPNDSGGATKYGITVDDLHEYNLDVTGDGIIDWHDVHDLTSTQASLVLKKLYWDFFKADNINNQSLAEYIVDGGLNQGRILIAKYVQIILGVTVDGLFGGKTLNAINMLNDPSELFKKIHDKRVARYDAIIKTNPSQKVFYNGWMNRVNAIKFQS
jgi:lysozyme family protein